MKIIIDLQGAQSESRYRGIGRYSLSLALAMVKNSRNHDISIALNGACTEGIEELKEAFSSLLSPKKIHLYALPEPLEARMEANRGRIAAAQAMREAFFAASGADMVHVSSLFEGWGDNAVSSVGAFEPSVPTAATLYDLIPYLHPEHYLRDPRVQSWYHEKIASLKRSDLLLAISESSRNEAIRELGIAQEKCVNISAAIDDTFCPEDVSKGEKEKVLNTYGITTAFILYVPGGFDQRKNFENLLKAFAMMPSSLRQNRTLVITGKGPQSHMDELRAIARKEGIGEQLILTGYAENDDLISLYRLCELFVFPSIHEGFGLPLLEAMGCAAAVIGSNATSIPEVIGRDDALFDPRQPQSICAKMVEVLSNPSFLADLKRHGAAQAKRFTWESCAHKALDAFEEAHERNTHRPKTVILPDAPQKPTMAFLSPLPPTKSGIADYSIELLNELHRYYDITLIAREEEPDLCGMIRELRLHTLEWFEEHWDEFDRILYHFGNSGYHSPMFELLKKYPGTVMLHDFYLSGALNWMEQSGEDDYALRKGLYRSHGYKALIDDVQKGRDYTRLSYPANYDVLSRAQGVLVHSHYSMELGKQWYGMEKGEFSHVPFLKALREDNRAEARQKLGFKEGDFVVCSFGMIHPTKLNIETLTAWLQLDFAFEPHCHLVFVGAINNGEYGGQLETLIAESGLGERVRTTGFVDEALYQTYLEAADVAVQLRAQSRGETSAAVFDALAHGVPLIVNAHGTMNELPQEGEAVVLADLFEIGDLAKNIQELYHNHELRAKMSKKSKNYIRTYHTPSVSAQRYAEAIEIFSTYHNTAIETRLIDAISHIDIDKNDLSTVVEAIVYNHHTLPQRQLLIDVSAIVLGDLKTGIQRVVRSIVSELLISCPSGYRVEPVYDDQGTYRYARNYTSGLADIGTFGMEDDVVEVYAGDVFAGLDFYSGGTVRNEETFRMWRRRGVFIHFVIYDLLPIFCPQYFMPRADEIHVTWLNSITKHAHSLICISQSVADEVRQWMKHGQQTNLPAVSAFHLGADVNNSAPSKGMSPDDEEVLKHLRQTQSFLTVGTIEPRKGHAQTLKAFELLWEKGVEVNLVIVGKGGWLVDELINRLETHPQLNKRLFWLRGISDEFLEKTYQTCSALIAASEGEGFGLPLIEAAQHKLPIIARDIPVFREVGGDHALYFANTKEAGVLADALMEWIDLSREGKIPQSDTMPWLTWGQSTRQFVTCLKLESDPQ